MHLSPFSLSSLIHCAFYCPPGKTTRSTINYHQTIKAQRKGGSHTSCEKLETSWIYIPICKKRSNKYTIFIE
ncbi:hypothetical protein MRB53_028268 [Persea americana]|uniref:Uncharacterized protein n=1 Tax=Persea americana TaxID=3435 RepID=A0ACC2KFL2_PERAE|nr:hypothetical protein MRB53_028268 [Persea americana]